MQCLHPVYSVGKQKICNQPEKTKKKKGGGDKKLGIINKPKILYISKLKKLLLTKSKQVMKIYDCNKSLILLKMVTTK